LDEPRPVGKTCWMGRELDFHVSEMFVEQAMIMEGDRHNSGDSVAELEERRVFSFTIPVGLPSHPCNNADRFRVNT